MMLAMHYCLSQGQGKARASEDLKLQLHSLDSKLLVNQREIQIGDHLFSYVFNITTCCVCVFLLEKLTYSAYLNCPFPGRVIDNRCFDYSMFGWQGSLLQSFLENCSLPSLFHNLLIGRVIYQSIFFF